MRVRVSVSGVLGLISVGRWSSVGQRVMAPGGPWVFPHRAYEQNRLRDMVHLPGFMGPGVVRLLVFHFAQAIGRLPSGLLEDWGKKHDNGTLAANETMLHGP